MIEPNRTRREKLLLNLLPAALVLAVYAFLIAIPAQQSYQSNCSKLESVRKEAIDQTAAASSRSSLVSAEAGLARLNEQLRMDRDQVVSLTEFWNSGDARLPTVQKLTTLLQQFNLSIVNQDFKVEPALSGYLQGLESIVEDNSRHGNLEYWQIELAGGYHDMMKFLQEVKTSGLRTFPLVLTMQASESRDGVHTWTLVFVV